MRIARVLAVCLLPSPAAAQSTTTPPVQVLHRFAMAPANPGPLVQVPAGDFYTAGSTGILRVTPAGQVTEAARIPDATPYGSLVLASDGGLYGTAFSAWTGLGAPATIFRFDPVTRAVRIVHKFFDADQQLPLGGLVAVGGSLYGVTRTFGDDSPGTIYHLVLATGEVVVDHRFLAGTLPRTPISPLTVGPDGFLYGTTGLGGTGTIYRFDPATDAVTVRHQFTVAEGDDPGPLTLGSDGSLYGTAAAGGAGQAGTLFRYTPATDVFQVLHSLVSNTDGSRPGPLLAGPDGHFYGVTTAPSAPFAPPPWIIFRLRNTAGTFTFETLRLLDGDAAGVPNQSALTLGLDGLIYGTTPIGGPTLAGTDTEFVIGGPGGPAGPGTIFRFDPAEGGTPPNAITFTLLNTLPLVSTWSPSVPTPGPDGMLYGLTSSGGSTNRGAAYRLNPTTGAVTILGEVPGILTGRTANSKLTLGNDGMLYGLSATFAPSPQTYRIVRVDPSTGTVTNPLPNVAPPNELVRAPSGLLYGMAGGGFARYDATANQLVSLSAFSAGDGPVTVTSDGQVYTVRQRPIPVGNGQGVRTSLIRLNEQNLAFRFDEIVLSDEMLVIDRLLEAPGGATYLLARFANDWAVVSVDRASGATARVCTLPLPAAPAGGTSIGPDGAIYGYIRFLNERRFRCDPATGAVTTFAFPPEVGYAPGALVTHGGMMYGAGSRLVGESGGVLFRVAAGTALPALDTDGDGLPNTWETAYGLDALGTSPGNGGGDDPDGDGRTNAQELADGTHPRGIATKLFAEGATGPFFRTRFDLSVPTFEAATVRARFFTDTGAVVAADLVVPARSHLDLDPATLPGLANTSFSSIFESDVELAVDRSMTWDPTGYGSHLETGVAAPSTTWFFAEGSTAGEFSLFYLLQNPHATGVAATITYLRPFGQPPIVRTYNLPAHSRTTIVVNGEAGLVGTDVSAAISATAPIVAERAMYVNRPGQPFAAGHDSAGVTTPALDWFLAEGATGEFFDLFVLIANPNTTAATVAVEYLRSSGAPLTKTYTVPAQSRLTIYVDDEELPAGSGQKPLAAANVSTTVRSTNAVPIIVERAMWWPGPTIASNFWYEAHNSPGATTTATRWVMGGGEIGGSDGAETYVLIANTTATAGRARVSIVGDDYGGPERTVDVPAKSRVTVSLREGFSGNPLPAGRYGVVVESLGPETVPLVVERATYGSPGGVLWGRGGNALATPLP